MVSIFLARIISRYVIQKFTRNAHYVVEERSGETVKREGHARVQRVSPRDVGTTGFAGNCYGMPFKGDRIERCKELELSAEESQSTALSLAPRFLSRFRIEFWALILIRLH